MGIGVVPPMLIPALGNMVMPVLAFTDRHVDMSESHRKALRRECFIAVSV